MLDKRAIGGVGGPVSRLSWELIEEGNPICGVRGKVAKTSGATVKILAADAAPPNDWSVSSRQGLLFLAVDW